VLAPLAAGVIESIWHRGLAQRQRVPDRQARVLVACGAASGIAAAYDVPIGGALFGLEVLLGSFARELLAPTLPFEQVIRKLLSLPAGHDLHVTAEDGALLGVIRLDALKGTISDRSHLGMIVAADEKERLPVVDEQRRLVGTVGMRDVLALGRS
jgi:CBS domain-containing protein